MAPFEYDSEKIIGYYKSKQLASKVWHFLNQVNDFPNVEIKIHEYSGEYTRAENGEIRLQRGGAIIIDKLDKKEYLRLINIDMSYKIDATKV
jgi:hypothetical protein